MTVKPLVTLLSEWGEGYCSACAFVVGLNWEGRLGEHRRGVHAVRDGYQGEIKPCKGSYRKPPRITPYFSRKAQFKLEAPVAQCHGCHRDATVAPGGYFYPHPNGGRNCVGSYENPR